MREGDLLLSDKAAVFEMLNKSVSTHCQHPKRPLSASKPNGRVKKEGKKTHLSLSTRGSMHTLLVL